MTVKATGQASCVADFPVILSPPFPSDGGYAFLAKLPTDLHGETDNEAAPKRSRLILLENGNPLGTGHTSHADIRRLGGGRYSFWKDSIWFSTPDNTDPSRNNRCYSVVMGDGVAEDSLDLGAPELNFETAFGLPNLAPRAAGSADLQARDALGLLEGRIVVLASSRTGSELLAYLLGSLGVDCHEYFNPHSAVSRGNTILEGQDAAFYVVDLCQRVANQILCTKGNVHRLRPLFQIGEFPKNMFRWRFIHLERKNVVQQAISLVIAELTGSYRSDLPARANLHLETIPLSTFIRALQNVLEARESIRRLIDLFDLRPLCLDYEGMIADQDRCVQQLRAFLDTPDLTKISRPYPQVQRDSRRADLERAFRTALAQWIETGTYSERFM
jgi:LPS sulfotransferase NodH